MASLFVYDDKNNPKYYFLGQRTSVVGRSESIPIQVVDDKVSRKHLQLLYDKEANLFYAVDMESRNGVFINGQKINDRAKLKDGDIIKIGKTNLMFVNRDFPNEKDAMNFYKRAGQNIQVTYDETL